MWQVIEGDPSRVVIEEDATLLAPVIRFLAPGEYTLRLTVSDSALAASESVRFIVLGNEPPTIILPEALILEWPERSFMPEPQITDDDQPEGTILTYLWTAFGEGSENVRFSNPLAARPLVTIASHGTYQFRLTVSDGDLESAVDFSVTVRPDPLTAWFDRHFSAAERTDPSLATTVWGPDADPDRDGLVNLVEAYAGTDPRVAGSRLFLSLAVDGDAFVLKWRRAKETFGMVADPQVSADLLGFESAESFDVTVIEDHGDWEELEGRLSGDLPERFFLNFHLHSNDGF